MSLARGSIGRCQTCLRTRERCEAGTKTGHSAQHSAQPAPMPQQGQRVAVLTSRCQGDPGTGCIPRKLIRAPARLHDCASSGPPARHAWVGRRLHLRFNPHPPCPVNDCSVPRFAHISTASAATHSLPRARALLGKRSLLLLRLFALATAHSTPATAEYGIWLRPSPFPRPPSS